VKGIAFLIRYVLSALTQLWLSSCVVMDLEARDANYVDMLLEQRKVAVLYSWYSASWKAPMLECVRMLHFTYSCQGSYAIYDSPIWYRQ